MLNLKLEDGETQLDAQCYKKYVKGDMKWKDDKVCWKLCP
jgi:hypothetical protein